MLFVFYTLALGQTEIQVSVNKNTIPTGIADFVYSCAGTGTLINGMFDLRPVYPWLRNGRDHRNGWNWWFDNTTVANPFDGPAVHDAMLARFVVAYNTPGIGPSSSVLDDAVPASAVEVTNSHGVDLIRPTNSWHPGHANAAGDYPPGAGPTPLWPDRCTLTVPPTGVLSIATALTECASSTALDAQKTSPPDPAYAQLSVDLTPGGTLTLTDLLQRTSSQHQVGWHYECAVVPPRDDDITSTLSQPYDLCQLRLSRASSIRESGRRKIDFAVSKHGPSNCTTRL